MRSPKVTCCSLALNAYLSAGIASAAAIMFAEWLCASVARPSATAFFCCVDAEAASISAPASTTRVRMEPPAKGYASSSDAAIHPSAPLNVRARRVSHLCIKYQHCEKLRLAARRRGGAPAEPRPHVPTTAER